LNRGAELAEGVLTLLKARPVEASGRRSRAAQPAALPGSSDEVVATI